MKTKLKFVLLFAIILLVILTIPSFASHAEGDTSYIDGLLNSVPLDPKSTGVDGLDGYINSIIAQAGPNATPAEKLRHCFNFIIDNTAYGYVDNGYTPVDGSGYCYVQYGSAEDREYITEALTVLTYHTGVCDDYSSTFVVMARAIGFDAYKAGGYINTKSGSKNGHQWTFINLNGTKFIFDPQAQQSSLSPNFFYGRTYEFTRCYELQIEYGFGGFNMGSPVFSDRFYAENNPDVVAAVGTNYFSLYKHFITYGLNEGRLPSPAFDIDAYYYYNPDIKAAFGDNKKKAYYHYLTTGMRLPECRRASYVFYVGEYKDLNPDVANAFVPTSQYTSSQNESNILCIDHFVNIGTFEDRATSYAFNMGYYKAQNTDLKLVYGNSNALIYTHAERHGMREGRKTSRVWHGSYYLNHYPDLKQAYKNDAIVALDHYRTFVLCVDYKNIPNSLITENRRGSEEFNIMTYYANYKDIADNVIGRTEQLKHYLLCGVNEGRVANQLLNSAWIRGIVYFESKISYYTPN